MEPVRYSKDYLSFIRELIPISPSIRFRKEGEKVVVCNASFPSKTLGYLVVAPKECFDFEGEELNFANYMEFYQFINAIDNVNFTIQGNDIAISNKSAVLKYRMSNTKAMPKLPKSIVFKDEIITAIIPSSDMKELIKISGMIKADYVKIVFENGILTLMSFREGDESNFTKTFVPTVVAEGVTTFNMITAIDIINKMPPDHDYTFKVNAKESVCVSFESDGISFSAFAGKSKKTAEGGIKEPTDETN
jgi:hypothetical protein